ncbi:P1 family peptidase [Caulobacter sp. S45]|uniref:P1 family peptidase n=1 Tax=Caulobacter sp. S45 TaxID=1641861 RepID=UPI00157538B9|nr:P1 family peptidase [Caulobacter sp. S45]
MIRPGPLNLITDVPGLRVGHATDEAARTGVTVALLPGGWTAAADVRGGGPGERDVSALGLENLVGRAHAIVLSGGSVYGLAAADGVTVALAQAGEGLRLNPADPLVPITPAAILYDLGNGGDKAWGLEPPYRRLGMDAVGAAAERFALGAVGAGRGAMAGARPGGLGSASVVLGDGLVVGGLAAVNPLGSVFMADGETPWAWPFEMDGEFGGQRPEGFAIDPEPMPDLSRLGRRARPGANTTLGVIAVSAALSGAECKRIAIMAHDGMARAIRPAHTPFDGDIVFVAASGDGALAGSRAVEVARIGSAAADCLARAIARGAWEAARQAGGQTGGRGPPSSP